MMNTQSLTLLLERCRAGEPEAVEEFVRRYGHEMKQLAWVILQDHAEAQDAAQDALIAALEHLDRFRGDSSLHTWLTAITVNACRARLRARQRRGRVFAALAGLFRSRHEPPVEETAAGRLDLRAALDCLSTDQRVAVALRYGHGLRVAEIAQATGVGQNTVLSRLYHARQRLQQVLEGEDAHGRRT